MPSRRSFSRRLCLTAGACLLAPRWAWGASKTLTIGQVASLSGSQGADLGLGLKAGVEACFQAVNAAGGIRGQVLRLLSKDDRYLPQDTVQLTRELIEQERPAALIGYRGTANTLALMQSGLLVRHGLTLVGTLSGAKEIQGAPGVLHLRTSYQRELTELVLQIQRMALDSVAVLYVDDVFGRTGLEAVEQAAAMSGSPLVKKVAYDKTADKVAASVNDAARALAASGAKALVVVGVGEPVYAFIKAFRPLRTSTRVFCMSVVAPAAVVQQCGEELSAGIGFSQVYPFPYSEKNSLVREYRKALAGLPGAPPPNYFSLEGYVYARVLVEALKRAPDGPTANQVSAALDALAPIDLGGLRVQIDPRTRNGLRYTDLTVLSRQGRLLG